MALDSYDGLKVEIAKWAWRTGDTEFEAMVPSFIRIAEARFDRDLRTHNMIGTSSIVTDEALIGVPGDWLETISIGRQDTHGLVPLESLTIMQEAEKRGPAGVPIAFCMMDGGIRPVPPPNTEYTYEFVYYRALDKLASDQQTNWLLATAPDLYLWASLVAGAAFMDDDVRIPIWGSAADSTISKMNEASKRAEYARGSAIRRNQTFG